METLNITSYTSGRIRKTIVAKSMEEAIIILEKEKQLLEDCLKGWKSENYPDAFKQRNKKLSEINQALNLIKNG